MNYQEDKRIVLTLDAGGTNFFFSAIQGCEEIVKPVKKKSNGHDLKKCLETITEGFRDVLESLPAKPCAISFAFPGPADYPLGIIDDLANLPGFRGGVALGPMLEKQFKLPVFINNDGNLFVLGEAISGFLPYVNHILKNNGSTKQYKNLFGITLGTGFGGGIVHDGQMMIGDNSAAGEIWVMRNKLDQDNTCEEAISIRAIKRTYAQNANLHLDQSPEPAEIYKIADGKLVGNQEAAIQAFRRIGENAGDALANAITLVDGLIVIGGGISKAHKFFLPRIIEEMNGKIGGIQRLEVKVFNFEQKSEQLKFVKGESKEIIIPGTDEKIKYDASKRIAVGISKLGTEKAICIGAYAFALNSL